MKGPGLWFHIDEEPGVVKFRDRKKNGGCQGLGGQRKKTESLMGTELQSEKMKTCGDGR